MSFEQLLQTPGVLIAIERLNVSIVGEDLSHLTSVKFVLNTNLNERNGMEGFILSMENERLSTQEFEFARIDEFFALKNYIVRNGLAVRK